MNSNQKILVAPLNWGLGHATRCIPIIQKLLSKNVEVVIGGDGNSLALLKHEFPELPAINLPSYEIEYSKKGSHFKAKLFLRSPKLIQAIRAEHKTIEQLVEKHRITGIISDNRLGLYTTKVPTVFLTHQLQVLSGKTTFLTTYIHHRCIKKFDECWIPDAATEPHLSGLLGHPQRQRPNVRYIGPLSRFRKEEISLRWDALVLLSGPEPQRSILEEILLLEFKKCNGKVLFVRGIVEAERETVKLGNIEIVNFLTSKDLEKAINQSAFIVSRSGYTTIMDLAVLQKKAFFIPTPGQTEQQYLAQRMKDAKIAPFVQQDDFKIKDLSRLSMYTGFEEMEVKNNLNNIFGLF